MSICCQWYFFMATDVICSAEALLIQLVFEHSLRIRFKAEGSKEEVPSTIQSASPNVTPETQSIEGSTTLEGGSDTRSDTTASSMKGKAKGDSFATKSAVAKDEKKKDNLVGRLNTLVTVDLENVNDAKDFLMISKLPDGLMLPNPTFECVASHTSPVGVGLSRHLSVLCSGMEVR